MIILFHFHWYLRVSRFIFIFFLSEFRAFSVSVFTACITWITAINKNGRRMLSACALVSYKQKPRHTTDTNDMNIKLNIILESMQHYRATRRRKTERESEMESVHQRRRRRQYSQATNGGWRTATEDQDMKRKMERSAAHARCNESSPFHLVLVYCVQCSWWCSR